MGKLECSFCGKGETEVAKLVTGTGVQGAKSSVCICDECLAKARKLISKKKSTGSVTPLK